MSFNTNISHIDNSSYSYEAASFAAGFTAGLPTAAMIHTVALGCCGIEPVISFIGGNGIAALHFNNDSFGAGFRTANLVVMMIAIASSRIKHHKVAHSLSRLTHTPKPEQDSEYAAAMGAIAGMTSAAMTTHLSGTHSGLLVGALVTIAITESIHRNPFK